MAKAAGSKDARGGRGGSRSAAARKGAGRTTSAGRGDARKTGARKAGARKGGARKGGARKTAGEGRKAAARKGGGARKAAARKNAGAAGRGRGAGRTAGRGGAAGRKTTRKTARKAAGGSRKTAGGGTRRNVRWIESPDQHAERPGQTLATRNHDVIRAWAEERNAAPATVGGTEHGDRLGVLRFDFPFGGRASGLEQVEWDQWFRTFDDRNLIFLFQEQMRDGRQSNFFQLDNPDREDG